MRRESLRGVGVPGFVLACVGWDQELATSTKESLVSEWSDSWRLVFLCEMVFNEIGLGRVSRFFSFGEALTFVFMI